MTRIMFVCHGNICRSPMAECILRDLAARRGLGDQLDVASCATSTEEITGGVGNPVYPPAKAELRRHGLDCSGKRAVQLTPSDYQHCDLLIAMDGQNVRNILRLLGGDPLHKVRKLMDYTPRGGDVADPWYTDRFDVAYWDILEGCEGLMQALMEGKNR